MVTDHDSGDEHRDRPRLILDGGTLWVRKPRTSRGGHDKWLRPREPIVLGYYLSDYSVPLPPLYPANEDGA